uniref:G-protein coupled receptors family 1 profile domain-containing protein n=1 Tax=Setaria digitata TaxID=48799 RepID=A0A915PN59_9BILA
MTTTTVISLEVRLLHKCENAFGQKMQLSECLSNLATLVSFEKQGIQQCAANLSLPQYIHNSDYDSTCGQVERQINQFAMPMLQLLCLSGNILNLLIYRLPYFQGSTSVHFLKVKAYANLVFVESRVFEVIHAWTVYADASFESFYWYTKPYVIAMASVSGTVSTWMTLVITIETVLCVLLPFHFRQICTKRISLIVLLGFVLCSIFLHLPFLFIQTVISSPVLKELDSRQHKRCYWITKQYFMQTHKEPFYEYIQKAYYWLQITLSIVIPNIAMLACSILIVAQFIFKNHGESFSQRRKCVIRMTVATTLSHLMLEGPALLTFAAVARKGANSSDHGNNICILAHGNNLLSVINAATPFFVFLAFSEQFRRMSLVYIQVHLMPRTFMKKESVPRHKKLQGVSSSVNLMKNTSPVSSNYTNL